MKNHIAFILSITIVVALAIGFSSCKEDEPPTPPKLSFAESSMTVSEDDGIIEVELVLDKAYSKDLTIEYDLGGTAKDQDAVGTATADYEVQGDHGVVVIESGETSGIIELEIVNDVAFEEDETIEISITDTNTSDIELTADDEIEITITNDDEQLVVSLASTAALTVNEADGGGGEFIEIQVNLDKPAPSNITINYSLEGSALDSTFAFDEEIPASYYDYYINAEKAGELVILSGQTSGLIQIGVYTDFRFENDETIELTLIAPSSGIQIGANNKKTITIEQQDGKIIALVWDDAHTDVDMDMFLWFGDATDNLTGVLATAASAAVTPKQELIFFPAVLMEDPDISDLAFGLSYNYYSGTANPMNFEVRFANFTEGVLEDEANHELFSASYTLVNLNQWDTQAGITPPVVQTFVITAGDFAEISDPITIPASGSRMKTFKLPGGIRKGAFSPSRPL